MAGFGGDSGERIPFNVVMPFIYIDYTAYYKIKCLYSLKRPQKYNFEDINSVLALKLSGKWVLQPVRSSFPYCT